MDAAPSGAGPRLYPPAYTALPSGESETSKTLPWPKVDAHTGSPAADSFITRMEDALPYSALVCGAAMPPRATSFP